MTERSHSSSLPERLEGETTADFLRRYERSLARGGPSRTRRGAVGDALVASRHEATSVRLPFVVILVLVAVAAGVLINSVATRTSDRDFREQLRADLISAQAEASTAHAQATDLQARLDASERERIRLAEEVEFDTAIDASLLEDIDRIAATEGALSPPVEFLAHAHYLAGVIDAGSLEDAQLISEVAARLRMWIDSLDPLEPTIDSGGNN